MAIKWSSWSYTGGNGMRVGIDVSVGNPKHTWSTCPITWKVYTQNQYNYQDPQQLNYSGNKGGTKTYTNTGGHGALVKRDEFTTTWNYSGSSYGSSPGSHSVTAKVTGAYNGSSPSVTVSIKVPARPYEVPNPPWTLTAKRNSDVRATLTWENRTSPGRPYSSVSVERQLDNGSFVRITTLSGSPQSYVHDGNGANREVQYRVRGNNSVGSSGWTYSSTYFTTPAAATAVVAGLEGANAIEVEWKNNISPRMPHTITIKRSVNGGAYDNVATGLAAGTTTWTDSSPNPGNNRYQVLIVSNPTPGNGSLTSAPAYSNTVSAIVPPSAPTSQLPNGKYLDAHLPITLTWKHNSGGDGARQSQFKIRYSSNNGTSWTTIGPVSTRTSSYELPGDSLDNGKAYLWQVTTRGTHADFGPWSSSATILTAATPAVTITGPVPIVTEEPVIVSWEFTQEENLGQAEWEGQLWDEEGTQLLDTSSGSGTGSGWELTYPIENLSSYIVKIRARANTIWSPWDEEPFTVRLLPPADVIVVPSFDPDTGTVSLLLTADDPVPGVTNGIDFLNVQRRINGGEWVTIFAGLEIEDVTTVIDVLPILNGLNEYRLIITSISPSTAISATTSLPLAGFKDGEWAFVNWGTQFSTIEKASCDFQVSETTSRARSTKQVIGRKMPILLVGTQRSHQLSLSFSAYWAGDCDSATDSYGSSREDWLAFGQEATIVYYRDWTGRRIYGAIGEVSVNDVAGVFNMATVTFDITEVAVVEGATYPVDRAIEVLPPADPPVVVEPEDPLPDPDPDPDPEDPDPPVDPPEVLTTLTQVTGDGFVTVTWTPVPGATGYRVGRNGVDSSGFGEFYTVDPSSARSRTFDKLINGTEYTFTVQPQPDGTPVTIKSTPASGSSTPPVDPPPVGGGTGKVPLIGRSGMTWNNVVFMGGDSAQYPQFENWRGRPVDGVMVFPTRYTYGQMGQTIPRRNGDLMVWSVSPFGQGTGVTNAQVASGSQDGNIAAFANSLKNAGWNTNRTAIRLGWENNGNWYEWGWDRGGVEAFRNAFRRWVTVCRNAGLTNVIWDWCLNKGPQSYNSGYSWTAGYPGDDVVDVIGIDPYDYYSPSFSESQWTAQTTNRNPGLEDVLAFAKAHNKLIAVDEWGVCHGTGGGQDNPWYINRMFQWLKANAQYVAWECTYDHPGNPGLNHKLSDGSNPLAAAAYRKPWPNGWGG